MAEGTRELHRPIAALAVRQHGLVTRDQLVQIGLSPQTLQEWVTVGRLDRLHRTVLRVGGAVPTIEQQALAACLAVSGLVAASHRCAAELWGIEVPEPGRAELTVTLGRSGRHRGLRVHRSSDLVPADITRLRGVPVTKPARTLVDLGAVLPRQAVADALDQLVGRKVITLQAVRNELMSLSAKGRAGVGALRAELDVRSGGETMCRTVLESLLFDLATKAGLPPMVFQHRIVVGGRPRRIDFSFPHLLVAIEVDGYESHSRYDVFEDDRVRGNELELDGWTVYHFTWSQVRNRPAYVVDVLKRALAAAA